MADYNYKLKIDVENRGIKETRVELERLKQQLEEAHGKNSTKFAKQMFEGGVSSASDAKKAIQTVIDAIDKLEKKGKNATILDMAEFNAEVGQIGVKIHALDRALEKSGVSGARALGKVTTATHNLGLEIDRVDDKFSRLGKEIQDELVDNVVNYGFDMMTDSINKAIYFTKDLDRTLTDISVVSGKSAEEMQAFAEYSNEAARALGSSTDEFAKSSLIFFQQGGYTTKEVQKLAEATTVAANITRQTTDVVADQLTAIINSFGVESGRVMTDVVDVFAKIGAVSGANFEELATATQKFASQAQTAGYEGAEGIQQMGAQIATVVETTRQSADSIGVGFKTILSRIQGIKQDKSGEMVTKLSKSVGQLNAELKALGGEQFEIFDQFGDLRGADELINDLGETWLLYGDRLSSATKQYLLQEVAGVEQASRLAALLDNWDDYLRILDEAQNSQGTALQQQLIYMDSIDAKAAELRVAFEDVVMGLNVDEVIKSVLDGATNLIDAFGEISEASSGIGENFAKVLGVSEKLGETLGAWVPILGVGVAAIQKFYGVTIATRLATANVKNEYLKQLNAQQASTVEEEKRLQLVKNIAIYSGAEEAQKYEKIQEQINKELEKQEHHLKVIEEINRKIKNHAKNNKELRENLKFITEQKVAISATSDILERVRQGETNINKLLSEQNAKTQDILKHNRHFQPLLDKELATEKEILAVLKKQEKAKDLSMAISEVSAVQKNLTGASTEEHKAAANKAGNNVNKLSQQQAKIEKLNKSMERTQLVLGGISAAALGGTQVFAGLNQIMEEGAANGLGFAKIISGIGTAILALLPAIKKLLLDIGTGWALALGPALPWIAAAGIAIGGLITLMGGFKSELVKVAEANAELTKTFTEQKSRIDALKDSLKGVEDSYKAVADSGLSATEILSSGNQELIDQYTKYAEAVSEINPALIQGYDSQGRAIIDLSKGIQTLNQGLAEQEQMNYRMLASNLPGYITEISANYKMATKDTNELVAKQKSLQEQMEKGMEIGDTESIKSASAQLMEINTQLAETQKVLSDTPALINANIVQPFFKSNDAAKAFGDATRETFIKTEKGVVNLGTAINASIVNVDALNDAVTSGDLDRATQIMQYAERAYAGFSEEVRRSGDSAEELVQQFVAMPQSLQTTALYMKGAFNVDILDDFQGKMQGVLGGTADIGEALNLNYESMDNAFGQKTQEKMDTLNSKLEELEHGYANAGDASGRAFYTNQIEEVKDQLEKAKDELDDYNKSVEDGTSILEANSDALKEVIEALEDTPEGYNMIVEGMESVQSEIDKLKEAMDLGTITEEQGAHLQSLETQFFDMFIGMNDESTAFYQNLLAKETDWVNAFQEHTGLVLTDYTNLQELMVAAEQAGFDSRTWLMSEETRHFAIAAAQEAQAARQKEMEKVNCSYFGSVQILSHWNSLKGAGFSTGQIIKSAFLAALEGIRNGFVDTYNFIIDLSNVLANVIGGIWNGIANVVNALGGSMGKYEKRGSDYGNIEHVSWSKDYMQSVSDDKYEQDLASDLVLDTSIPNAYDPSKYPGSGSGSGSTDGAGSDKVKPGGGGADKDKDKDKKKDVEDVELELDPLYEYTQALKMLENEMEILQAKEKDLFGKDLIDNLQEQNGLLQQKLKILESQKVVIDQQLARQKGLLSSKGFTFDESGMITNYNEMIEKLTNAANAKTGEAKEQAIADLKQIKETVKDYDKFLTDTNAKIEEDLIKIRQEIQENYQEQIEIVVDVNLDLSEAYEKIYEFQQKFNEGFDKTSESLENMGEYAQSLMGDMTNMETVIEKIKNDANLTEKQKGEMLKKYIDEYMDSAEKLDDVIKEMGEKITESLEEGLELIEETAEGYEKIKDYASEYADLLLDMYGPAAKDDIDALFQVQIDAQKGILDSLQSQKQLAEQYVNALEPGSDEWKAAKEELDEINMEIANNTLGLLDLMREKMQSFFDLSREALEQDIFGGKALDEVEDAFDRINAQQDKYVNTAEKINKIGKLQVAIQEEIEKTTDPKKKALLQAFLDKEIKALKEKDKLTEKDVERAEKVYLLLLKQQAVQTSQMTAMMARLVRDEAGNWSYEYVQDVNKVNEAQQELADGLEDLMNSDKDNLKENQEEMLGMYDQYFADLQKLQEQAMSGKFESPEEFNAAVDALNEQLLAQMTQLEKEQEELINNMMQSSMAYYMQMYQQSGGNLGIFSSQTEGVLGGLLGALDKGSLAWSDIMSGNYKLIAAQLGITEEEAKKAMEEMTSSIMEDFEESNAFIETDYEDLRDKVQQAATDMKDAFNDYFTGVEENMGNQETAIADLIKSLESQKTAVDNVTQAVKDEANAITNTLIPSYNSLKDKYEKEVNPEAQKFVAKLKESIEELKNNNTAITGSKGLNEALSKLQDEFEKSKKEADALIGDKDSGLKGMEASANSAFEKVTTVKGKVKTDTDTMNRNVSGVSNNLNGLKTTAANVVSSVNTQLAGIKDKTVTATVRVKDKIVKIDDLGGSRQRYTTSLGYTKTGYGFDIGDILTFKTGGYTGNWSGNQGLQEDKDRGKLAVLHQKEMVLNKQDTQNLLDAVKINREVFSSMLKTNPQTSSVVTNNASQGDTIIQVDKLELPNVNNADDFVKELKNLPNRAIQYKYTKKS